MPLKTSICLLTVLLLISDRSFSQETTLFDYLSSDGESLATLKIDTDLKHLIRHKNKEKYQDAKIAFNLNDKQVLLDIKLRARGNTRKQACQYPPLKLNFSKKHLDSLGFVKSQDNLKMVIPCKDNDSFIERLKMEHFIYQLFSIIEPNHLKSSLVNVEFWKDGKLDKDFTGFLVEDEEHYENRLDATIVEKGSITSGAFNRENFLKFCFFQYMIANTDWAIINKHNMEIVKIKEFQRVIPIAYDFDYAGLINQPYAVPHESLPIEYVTERHFYKNAIKKPEALATAKFFEKVKPQIIAICDNALYLREKTRENIKKFIEGFYNDIDSEKKIYRLTNAK